MTTETRYLIEEIRDRFPNAPYQPGNSNPILCEECNGAIDDHKSCIVPAIHTLLDTLEKISDAALLITHERQRQIEQEGYDAEHDDGYGHRDGEIAHAAAAYALGSGRITNIDGSHEVNIWPRKWGPEDDTIKRKPRIRQLVIAGALIIAEIERLQRKEKENR